jgi:hypothetical protein
MTQLYPWTLGSHFIASYDSQDYSWGFLTLLQMSMIIDQKSKLIYDWRSVNQCVLVSSLFW